ncbi:PAS domain-containing sensor histidine kinase [Tellurirhabdus bombi]|uniref:PAS domain-containing sensor histidine kinase n=1 Tax=Tellurirhabdus bombi TaxID=2907205 RepID=UPI001F1731BF|nr:ATP-binding protein [Tellurirhabdus bombi]
MKDSLDAISLLAIFEKSANSLVIKADPPRFTILAVSDKYLEISRTKREDIIGKGVFEVFPDNESDPSGALSAYKAFMSVIETKKQVDLPVYKYDILVPETGLLTPFYWSNTNVPILGGDGQVAFILNTTADITDKVLLQQKEELGRKELARYQQRLNELFTQAPVAVATLIGPEHVVEVANERILEIWGKKSEDVLNKPIFEGLHEAKGQGLEELLTRVYHTGQRFVAYDRPITLPRNGQLEERYVDFLYEPLREAGGTVTGISVVAIDVTDQVHARKKIEESQERLNLILEASGLGNWDFDIVHKRSTRSLRHDQIFGYESLQPNWIHTDSFNQIYLPDQPRARQEFERAFKTGSLQLEVRIVWPDQTLHWIKIYGKIFFDQQQNPIRIVGTVADIDLEKKQAEHLEEQVTQRTLELSQAVQNLQRSNTNLEQFAYVASHDLQEPLRKIQSFSNILESQYTAELSADVVSLIKRMASAAERMSGLIRDLLTYSRLTTHQQAFVPISLGALIHQVLENLEVQIYHEKAHMQIDDLPTLNGDVLQLSQLFQNLISNAIKFHLPDVVPQIHIGYRLVSATELPQNLKPASQATSFHQISVADNGIGFDEKYLDRIFEIFQRLHGRSNFSGTGIGLAICQKVVINHGGAITASSQPGKGATFVVYLPA